ncbi:hypothetical protein [Croceimicrobium hydrocarbonivorans]|uniref:Uncharacterized protein n=1 Tax=Croceimicrobium hydrocarbonivorans TaxID=2761580 RepID=A0A7H0VFQ6_9FLAO|nr:hypothetical protein [Croceimicrobium hydrocarbonivorans]QNR24554.1 hypothetical protein H4K34_01555 [Croceimicrobium hydrocarbonivorans]
MSSYPECDKALEKAHESGDPWNYCTEVHCDETVNYGHQFCNCTGQFEHIKVGGVCPNGVGSLIPIAQPGCYCCCSCFAYDTPISTGKDTYKVVQDFEVNDPVWVATDASLKNWVQKPVKFSSGTGAHGTNRLILLHYGFQKRGVKLDENSFESRYTGKSKSKTYFEILSTAPNNYIDQEGYVNLELVRNANVAAFTHLLNCTEYVAQQIYDLLSSDSNYLLVTGIQPFLLKDGSLKQAHKLVPGKDELLREDGTAVPIVSLQVGQFEKGVHHIATSNKPAKSVAEHLILANGIVAGDYSLQLSLASGIGVKDDHADAPIFGSKEYEALHDHLSHTPFSAFAKEGAVIQNVKNFIAGNVNKVTAIPSHAYSFITNEQATELMETGPIYPASENVSEPYVKYLFKLFSAFYPGISFFYDANNMFPNVYAFQEYDTKVVIVTAGWTSVKGVNFQLIALSLADIVNQLLGIGTDEKGTDPVAQADYNTFPVFLTLYFFAPDAVKNYNLALPQLEKVFGYIKENRKPKHGASLDCRLDSFKASINGTPLPHCAGGPPDPALEVKGAKAQKLLGGEDSVISIAFNLDLDVESAQAPGNYMLEPSAAISSARMDPDNPNIIHLQAKLNPETDYTVIVNNVLSVDKQPLIIGKNSAEFKTA